MAWSILVWTPGPGGASNRDIVINEVMANPADESKGEFVELYNRGGTPVDVAGWILADRVDQNDAITDYTEPYDLGVPGTVIPPQGYALIVDPDYDGVYNDQLSRHADLSLVVMLTVAGDRTLGNGLGNTGDTVILDDGADWRTGFAWTQDAGGDGVSWEKRVPGGGNDGTNWAPSISPSGATPGARNSVTPARFDVGIAPEDIRVAPVQPVFGEPATITVVVRNVGFDAVGPVAVTVFVDADGDSIAGMEERLADASIDTPLSPGDSAVVVASWQSGTPGIQWIGVRLTAPADERDVNDFARKRVGIAFLPGTLAISELMYAPRPGDPEWIEFRNMTDMPVDLAGWTIEDADSTDRRIIAGARVVIAPTAYVIVTSDTSDFVETFPEADAPVLQPSGGLPALNNTGDVVTLRDFTGRIIDRVAYTRQWGGGNHASLERRLLEAASQDSLNWGTSRSVTLSTPGKENSLTPPPVDASLRETDVRITPLNPGPEDRVTVAVVVRNTGRQPVSGVRILVTEPLHSDAVVFGEQLIPQVIAPGDSAIVAIHTRFSSGVHRLAVDLFHPDDGDTTNNHAAVSFAVRYPPRALVINEIMFDPGAGETEWIELFNRSATPVDLNGWTVATSDSTKPRRVSDSRILLPSQGYAVLASDTAALYTSFGTGLALYPAGGWPGLRNTGSPVVIRDMTGVVVDRVDYQSSWSEEPGRSAERIHPDRPSNDADGWGPSAAASGGTPGERNSLFATDIPERLAVDIQPNPFSPDGDGRDDVAMIHISLPVAYAVTRLFVYDMTGRLLKTLLDRESVGSRRTVLWDGTDNRGRLARIGGYILYLEMMHPDTGRLRSIKRLIVLGG